MTADDIARLAYLGLLGAAIAGFFFVQNRDRMGQMAQQAAIWGLIFVGTIAAVGMWSDIRSTVLPAQATMTDGRIELPMGRDGHYRATVDVDGVPIDFIVDTGASDVVLSDDDAARLGIDVDSLAFLGSAATANGTVRIAPVWLDRVTLGGITDRDVRASVTEGRLDMSLLGMSYLRRFDRIEIANDRLILTR